MALRDLEYTKGGGWSPICDDATSAIAQFTEEQRKFSEFIHDHIGKQITVRIQLKSVFPEVCICYSRYRISTEFKLDCNKVRYL